MKKLSQTLEALFEKLSPIDVDWKNGFADEVISEIGYLKEKVSSDGISQATISHFLDRNFDVYSTVFQLFLGLSKDQYRGILQEYIPLGSGITSFKKDPAAYLRCLIDVLFLDAKIRETISFEWTWKDVLVERLRCGRGSAIQGQRRGRFLEDEVEKVIREVFGTRFERGINFTGLDGRTAKAEFAIPDRDNPAIIFEAKAYGATGSKQTDVIGDIEKIVKAKKPATDFLFITDGMTWKARASDFRKIITFQNDGYIRKIYTLDMMDELRTDLEDLKHEHGLETI